MLQLPIAIFGCGVISRTYLKNLKTIYADRVKVVAVADVVPESATKLAAEFLIERVGTTDELLADPSIKLVMNLTPAPVHFALSRAVLRAGKHLYSEKPLALTMDQAHELVALAWEKKVRLSVAPDTVMGDSVQAAKRAIVEGRIGKPVVATGILSLNHANDKYASVFRGPVLDLGPYHVGAYLELFGSARAVTAITKPFPQAPADHPQLSPAALTEDTPLTAGAVIEFDNGVIATLVNSAQISRYEPSTVIYGTTGVLNCGDPNYFNTLVTLEADGKTETLTERVDQNFRGRGVWDMAQAIADNRAQYLGPDLALHATEILLAIVESGKTGQRIDLTTRCQPRS